MFCSLLGPSVCFLACLLRWLVGKLVGRQFGVVFVLVVCLFVHLLWVFDNQNFNFYTLHKSKYKRTCQFLLVSKLIHLN